jgi:3-deoxy-7-phosphoheptulonate synthase
MIPAIKALTKMPILVDGSHGTGRRDLVEPMTLAGIAAGADGCLVEFHNDPDKSISDSDQALSFKELDSLMFKIEEYIKLRRHLNELSSVLL